MSASDKLLRLAGVFYSLAVGAVLVDRFADRVAQRTADRIGYRLDMLPWRVAEALGKEEHEQNDGPAEPVIRKRR